MLSKEEIENSFIRIETICKKEVCLFNQPIIEGNLNQIKRYIIQLESNQQNITEKLLELEFKKSSCVNMTEVGDIYEEFVQELEKILKFEDFLK